MTVSGIRSLTLAVTNAHKTFSSMHWKTIQDDQGSIRLTLGSAGFTGIVANLFRAKKCYRTPKLPCVAQCMRINFKTVFDFWFHFNRRRPYDSKEWEIGFWFQINLASYKLYTCFMSKVNCKRIQMTAITARYFIVVSSVDSISTNCNW